MGAAENNALRIFRTYPKICICIVCPSTSSMTPFYEGCSAQTKHPQAAGAIYLYNLHFWSRFFLSEIASESSQETSKSSL